MRDRRFRMRIRGEDLEERKIDMKILQESSLSPLLFLIYISNMFREIEMQKDVTIVSFADDIMIIIMNKSLIEVGNRSVQIRKNMRA